MKKYKKGTIGYYKELAKEVEYPYKIEDNIIGPFLAWAKENGILVNPTKINRERNKKIIENSGCKTNKEYRDKNSQKLGFRDDAERIKEWKHETERQTPMEFNEDCSSNFGVHKGEKLFKRFLEEVIFEETKESGKGSNDRGVDFVCKNPRKEFTDKYPQFRLERNKKYTMQLKNICLRKINGWIGWDFPIGFNNLSDYFILCAWDNRDSLNPLHIWIFHKNDIVRGNKFWRRDSIKMTNKTKYINDFGRYRLKNEELEKLKDIMKDLREELIF